MNNCKAMETAEKKRTDSNIERARKQWVKTKRKYETDGLGDKSTTKSKGGGREWDIQ